MFYLSLRCFYNIKLNFTNIYKAWALILEIYFYCPLNNDAIVSSTNDIKESLNPVFENDCLSVRYLYFKIDYFLTSLPLNISLRFLSDLANEGV
jgi:hypothetical protein